jgi:hypothetical protein
VVATPEPDHQYSRSLYREVPGVRIVPTEPPDEDLEQRMRSVDVVHVSRPEHFDDLVGRGR